MKLRCFEEKDAEMVTHWFKDEYAMRLWCASNFSYPLSADDINKFYREKTAEGGFFALAAVDEAGNTVGQCFARYIDEEKTEVRLGLIVVDPEIRGKGYGSAMIRLATEYGFEQMNGERVTLNVFCRNKSAYNCYSACGFKENGETQTFLFRGEQWNAVGMEVHRQAETSAAADTKHRISC